MTKSRVVRSFRELEVYGFARQVSQEIFALSSRFPAEERYSLNDQMRRASRAVKAMIAEAWGRRRYKAVFICKLDEALGEANEVRAWLDDALDARYLTEAQFKLLDAKCESVAAMLSRMIDRADAFCRLAPGTDFRALAEPTRSA